MKARFHSVDIRCIVPDLHKKLVGLRLSNVYDLGKIEFLLKFSSPEAKEFVIIESGNRIHTTKLDRKTSQIPSFFVQKLRKHIRAKRLTHLEQIGFDRIIDLTFGSGEAKYHLILEFFAKGNVILTDAKYVILSLLRSHELDSEGEYVPQAKYRVDKARVFEPLTKDRLEELLSSFDRPQTSIKQLLNSRLDYGPSIIQHCCTVASISTSAKMKSIDVAAVLGPLFDAFAEVDSTILSIGTSEDDAMHGYIVKQAKLPEKPGEEELLESIEDESKGTKYVDFSPIRLQQYSLDDTIERDNFDAAVDEFFTMRDMHKGEDKRQSVVHQVTQKSRRATQQHEERLSTLQFEQSENERQAQLIEYNVDAVDHVLEVIRGGVAASHGWKELEDMINEQKRLRNPVALMIDELRLNRNEVVLLLDNPEEKRMEGEVKERRFDSYDGEKDREEEGTPHKKAKGAGDGGEEEEEVEEKESGKQKRAGKAQKKKNKKKKKGGVNDADRFSVSSPKDKLRVVIDISLSAHGNVRKFYEMKKRATYKETRTQEVADVIKKSSKRKERQAIEQLEMQEKHKIRRRVFWFEKFDWFISSENYLVIGGRDAHQNEVCNICTCTPFPTLLH
jgi:predicted ribosome quality control (RQC) complex YloA/Tae2 family protein